MSASTSGKSAPVIDATSVASWFKRNEIPRKTLHGSIAILTTVLFVNGVQPPQVTPVLVSLLIPISILEAIRFALPSFNRIYISVIGSMMRESEKTCGAVNGVIWYLAGLIIVFSVFTKDIGVLSVYLLSWADLAASSVGRAYGYMTPKLIGKKSLAGSLAAFVTGLLCTQFIYRVLLPFWPEYNPPSTILYNENLSSLSLGGLSLIMGLAAAIFELFPLIDDNFSIPIGCACVQWLAIKYTTLPYSHGVLA